MSDLDVRYRQLLESMSKVMVFKICKILETKNKIASGRLIKSIDAVVSGKTGENFIKLIGEDYWYFVDQGRKPGKGVPIKNLLSWMDLRGIDKKYSYAINNKIKKEGIKGIYFLEQAVNEVYEEFRKEITTLYPEQLEEELNNKLKASLNIT